ncbi:unnamed protein product [Phytophthora lilii]|uniref:Unnamed protein product n=1 Tax=Phytophthora lilii TaxID=2077276 RepID=A0A9W6TEE7_9STRA|nr:unnamed protein product [Phytophthora lilii]
MPTQLTRQAVTSFRHQDAKSIDQSRRREMVCNLLTQIYRLAERTRAAKSSSRRQASSADRDEDLETEDSISLIELIQASYSVFERYGIGPPDDAVYHRYLLSLSINPERDWRKKILNFDLGSQPRVKRLCWAAGHRHGSASKTANEHTDTKNVKVPVVAVDSVSHTLDDQRRRRSDSKQSLVRRASLLSESSTPTQTYDSHFGSKHQQLDHFGDMLSLDSPIQRIPVENDKRRRRAFKAAVVMSKTLQNPIVNDYKVPTSLASAPNIVNSDAEDQRQSSNGDISFSSAGRASGKRIERMAAGERQLQMITTSIEQWRATQAVKQLVIQDKLQDHNSRQQQLILPLCIRAVFHWVTMCLPEKIDFRTTESPRTLPLCVLRRISVDVIVLKQSAKRVWVWQMKTLMQEWRQDARATKAFRVRMIIKQRAAVLETAFQCIQHWRLFTETRKCSADREQWIAQRCSRSRLRICLHHWHKAFQSRQQQHLIDKRHTSLAKEHGDSQCDSMSRLSVLFSPVIENISAMATACGKESRNAFCLLAVPESAQTQRASASLENAGDEHEYTTQQTTSS